MPISCKYHEMVTINMANFQIAFSNFPNLSKAFRFVSMVNPLQYIYCYYNNWKLRTCLISYSLQAMNFKRLLVFTRIQKATQGATKYCGSYRLKILQKMNRINLGHYSLQYRLNFEHIFGVPFVVTSFCFLFISHQNITHSIFYTQNIINFKSCQQFVLNFMSSCEPFVIMSQYTPRENDPIWYPVLI